MATEITLLEIDAPNAQFNAPFSGRGARSPGDRDGTPTGETTPEVSASGRGPARALPVLVLLGIVVLAVVLRAVREETRDDQESDTDRS